MVPVIRLAQVSTDEVLERLAFTKGIYADSPIGAISRSVIRNQIRDTVQLLFALGFVVAEQHRSDVPTIHASTPGNEVR